MVIALEDEAVLGTEKKYVLDIKSTGFDMEDDDFEVEIRCGLNTLRNGKSEMIKDLEGNFYFTFNTADLGVGLAKIIVTAHVPDGDFLDGIRDEVDTFRFLRIRSK